jgi:hypothetical protein
VKSLRKHLIGVVLVLGSGTLLAQTPDQPGPADKTAPSTATLQIPADQMIKELPALVETSQTDAQIVLVLQIKARKEKDVIKLNCINDKLLQIRALRNALERSRSSFEGASGRLDEQQEAFTSISSHVSEIRVLREQAQVCAGEGELRTDSVGDWQGPDLPDDPGKDLFPDGVEQPGYASPYN